MSGIVVVAENGKGRYQQAITAGQHQLIADEPASMGGADAGPAPFDFIMSGLGACTSMTLRQYAKRHGLSVDDIEVSLSHTRDHAEDCAASAARPVKIDRIVQRIDIHGHLSALERERLLEVAERCPVHRTLDANPRIETRYIEDDPKA